MTSTPITVAYGDGIGPEIMRATLSILDAAGAKLDIDTIEIGEQVYLAGNSSGIPDSAWDSLARTKVFLKAPITTPQGGGVKSLNVTVRKTLSLYANVRPCVSYMPYVRSLHSMDIVIVRENEEDLYGGIEHQQTVEVTQCLKLISRPGSERIIRYAFEYALKNGRKKVTCISKDNIMKVTDGLFHKVFNEIAAEYPSIEADHLIVDIGAARIATRPEIFDVIVTENLYGDILSDIAAEVAGSVGIAGSANIGEQCAMFEAIHGSAPDIAGKGIANPSGLLMGAVMMLVHIGQPTVASKIHNAWLRTLEEGIHTGDIYSESVSKELVGTEAFTAAVIARLGQAPTTLKAVDYDAKTPEVSRTPERANATAKHIPMKTLTGVDLFFDVPNGAPNEIAERIQVVQGDELELVVISNRGTKVWPKASPFTLMTDHWRCRMMSTRGEMTLETMLEVIARLAEKNLPIIKLEMLFDFDGKPGYSLAQGQVIKK